MISKAQYIQSILSDGRNGPVVTRVNDITVALTMSLSSIQPVVTLWPNHPSYHQPVPIGQWLSVLKRPSLSDLNKNILISNE